MEKLTISKDAAKDIDDLKLKIEKFKNGELDEERFKAFRLTRGVYGQRQPDVQMLRIKIPYGKISPCQIRTIADLSDEYTNGKLHITTRQDIQLHYIKLEDTPSIWSRLEQVGVTTKESCGNTVRNVTASPYAGIDPNEPFDVSPYAQAVFEYFLRNPICQEMGRKIKIAFSSSREDSAFTYIHDFGFIPKIVDGIRGFKVLLGGGLGAQALMAQEAYEFLPGDKVIPFIEAGLRVFDRYGERERRHKARLKFLIEPKKGIGINGFLKLVEEEKKSLPYQSFLISWPEKDTPPPSFNQTHRLPIKNLKSFELWKKANVFEQKQDGYYAVKVRIPLGNLDTRTARGIALIAEKYASDDMRLTVNQGLILKYLKQENLPNLYAELEKLDLAEPGFDSLVDITACPGTDTCNLGVTNSTSISEILEKLVRDEYPHLVHDDKIKIKISGCMNSCGQHMIANIGFHGSSLKVEDKIAPAMQVVIGGGVDPDGKGYIAEKVIKIPTKRIPKALRIILDDYEANSDDEQYFNDYFRQKGKKYFYDLLRSLSNLKNIHFEEFQDWGENENYVQEIGVGECAGVVLDLVATILNDAEERLTNSEKAIVERKWADAIYWSYNSMVIGAKALLLSEDIQVNTQKSIIDTFYERFQLSGKIDLTMPFDQLVLQINVNAPGEQFARKYFRQASELLSMINEIRRRGLEPVDGEKLVVSNYYKA